jgi:hypothetical protein
MASNHVGEDWKRALDLLESSVQEWEKSLDKKHKLTYSERVSIDLNLEAVEKFAEENCTNFDCLSQFLRMYERMSVQLHLALMKMNDR